MDAAGTVHHGATCSSTAARSPTSARSTAARRRHARTIDARGAIVVPGLVNAHTHLAMTMFRGLADDLDLERLPGPAAARRGRRAVGRRRSPPAPRWRSPSASAAGITTALDMYFFPEAAADVAADGGLRPARRPGLRRVPGRRRPAASTTAWRGPPTLLAADRRRRAAGSARTARTCSTSRSCAAVGDARRRRTAPASTSTPARRRPSSALVRDRHGRTPIEVLRDTGLLGPGTVLAHGVHLTDDDIALVAAAGADRRPLPGVEPEAGQRVRPHPRAARRRRPRRPRHRRRGVGQRPRPVAGDAPGGLPAGGARTASARSPRRDVLAMATTGGARAAGDAGRSGRSRSARAPTSSCSTRRRRRSRRPTTRSSTAAYAASRADVRWVVAGGRLVVDDRRLTTIDVDAAIAAVRDLGPRDPGGDRPMNADDVIARFGLEPLAAEGGVRQPLLADRRRQRDGHAGVGHLVPRRPTPRDGLLAVPPPDDRRDLAPLPGRSRPSSCCSTPDGASRHVAARRRPRRRPRAGLRRAGRRRGWPCRTTGRGACSARRWRPASRPGCFEDGDRRRPASPAGPHEAAAITALTRQRRRGGAA